MTNLWQYPTSLKNLFFGCGLGVVLHCLYFLFLWFQEASADMVAQVLCLCPAQVSFSWVGHQSSYP